MNFLLAIIAYLAIGLVLGCGILLAVKGSPWLLVAAVVTYVLAFARLGCLPGKGH